MSVTLAVRFPLGRYHATAWDRSVNEGAVEWPPSPWRLLRALVATWYTRWPDLPAPTLDGLLETFGDPPSYWTCQTRPAHTRHYLPDAEHTKGEHGNTTLTLDPYLSLPQTGDHLLVRWQADLTADQHAVLTKLAELVPYLGRAESVCEIRALTTDPQPDHTWWQPQSEAGTETVRLLAPTHPISRPILEQTTMEVRRSRRTLPPGTTWITYTRTPTDPPAPARPLRETTGITAVRFAIAPGTPIRAAHGVLLADEVHRLVTRSLDGGPRELVGHAGAATNHSHAHWIPIASNAQRGATVAGLTIWVPSGLTADEIAAIVKIRKVSGQRGRRGDDNAYELKGLPETTLLLQGIGPIEQIAPDLCQPSRTWQSLTPYLPVRHPKRTSLDDYVAADVRRELEYRGEYPAVTVTRVHPDERLSDRWSLEFRRYRVKERLNMARRGLGLRLTFAEPVSGPLLLGQLSHFGYGIFTPEHHTYP